MEKYAVRKLVLLIAALFILLACELPALPLPAASNPSPVPGALETIVAATAGAAQAQTMLALPSPTNTLTSTPLPTSTPTETPTVTQTFIFILPTLPTATEPFVTQSAGANCQVIAQTPVDNTQFDSREAFTTEWTIRNTGSEVWSSNNLDFFHSGGTDMHNRDVLDLPNNVGTDGEVTFKVEMVAPRNSGTYTSTWSLGKQNKPLCKVSVTIVVR